MGLMSMTSFSDIQNVAFPGPAFEIDKIITAFSFTAATSDVVSSGRLLITYSASFLEHPPNNYQVVGISQYHTNPSWNDLADYNLSAGFTLAPVVTVRASCSSSGAISFNLDQTALVNGGSPYSVTVKFAVIAPQDANLDLEPDRLISASRKTYTNGFSYMKIAKQGNYATTGTATTTIPHGLGYVPFFDVYQIASGSMTRRYNFMDNQGATADENNIYIYSALGAGSATIYYRIYYEN